MQMPEFFIVANSFAAPIVSDQSTHYVKGWSWDVALDAFREQYRHPCGLYGATVYRNADDWHKHKPELGRWLSAEAEKAVEAA